MASSFGRYTLVRKIGAGGMAEIWRAKATGPAGFEKFLAIKTILPELAEDRMFVSMFVDEAKLAAVLVHPNVVQVFDFGSIDGRYFLAMEYVPGTNLARLLDRMRNAGCAPSAEAALYVVREAARGLGYAHAKTDPAGRPLNIVHRDVSPQNILVSPDGGVKVGDFGIAKASSAISRTAAGHVRGKLAYMSPEQVTSEPLDGRSDLFSLGVVLYEMVTGARLFRGSSVEDVYQKVRQFRPLVDLDLASIPDELRDVLVKALQPNPSDRYPNAAALEAELGERLGVAGMERARKETGSFIAGFFAGELRADATDENSGDTAVGADLSKTIVPELAPTLITPGPGALPPAVLPGVASPARKQKSRMTKAVAGTLVSIAIAASGIATARHFTSGGGTVPRYGGTLHVAIDLDTENFDAYTVSLTRSRIALDEVLEDLYATTRDGEVIPWTVQRATLSDGGRTIALQLRPDLFFHDNPCFPKGAGRRPTGEDLAYSLRQAILRGRVPLAVNGADAFRAGTAKDIAGIVANADGVTLSLSEPSPFYESAFLDVRLVPHDLEGCDDLARMHQPVGTGPFRFTAPPHGNRILIERAPHYRQSVDGATLPYLDAIEIQQAESPAAAIARLGNGDLDIYFPASRDWDRVVDVSGSRIRPAESLKSLDLDAAAFSSRNDLKQFGLWLSNADGPLRDRRVREAIARSIDRPALVAASDRVLTAPAGRFFDSRVLGFDPSAPSIGFDPARAQALLAEAGHPGGAGLRPLVFGTMEHAKVGEVLVQQLARAGLHASIVKIARGDVMRLLQDGSVDALLATNNSAIRGGEWGAVLLDLQPGRTADPVLVPFERELASTQERADRAGVYKRIEAKLLWELPAVPIAWVDSDRPYYVFVLRRKVHGFNDPVTGYARLPDLGNAWLAR